MKYQNEEDEQVFIGSEEEDEESKDEDEKSKDEDEET